MYGDSTGVLSVIYMEEERTDRSVWTRNGKALFSGTTCTGIPWELCLLTTWRRGGGTGVSGHGMVSLYFLVPHVQGFTEHYFFFSFLVYSVLGNQGNIWKEANINIGTTPNRPFRIQFVASRGLSFQSDIAIDDINIHSGQCPRSGNGMFTV